MEMEEAVMRSKEERAARKGMAGACDVTRCCGPLWPMLSQRAWQCAKCHSLQRSPHHPTISMQESNISQAVSGPATILGAAGFE